MQNIIAGGVDPYDIVDAKDVLGSKKFQESWAEKLVTLPKWNEKTAELD